MKRPRALRAVFRLARARAVAHALAREVRIGELGPVRRQRTRVVGEVPSQARAGFGGVEPEEPAGSPRCVVSWRLVPTRSLRPASTTRSDPRSIETSARPARFRVHDVAVVPADPVRRSSPARGRRDRAGDQEKSSRRRSHPSVARSASRGRSFSESRLVIRAPRTSRRDDAPRAVAAARPPASLGPHTLRAQAGTADRYKDR